MRDLINQTRLGIRSNLYYLSLYGALALPDICGALSSANGQASGEKYKKWFDKYVGEKYEGFLDGEDCYFFRCSLLHQGSSQHPKNTYGRYIFIEPSASGGNIFHCNVLNDALNIDVRVFCEDILAGAETWLAEAEKDEQFVINFSKFMRRYENGLAPYIVGLPVIS
ncbi:hypothetical protein DP73_04890 [Desulfosporosinus sp. HMP52]|uniref:hypothetical protein n=1 Tax=Desulfosporosinus sp. HMP52 TaxID=1487923 RepID=UPI00051FDA8E|nr:hypothetical protein [Desulfosporosinus sp. HMP52]KGK91177.1 hypothetical protein DP73_04890 [Desulfosporosinus sp. HMP52]